MPKAARARSVSLRLREPLSFPSERTLAKGPLSERDGDACNDKGDKCQGVSLKEGRCSRAVMPALVAGIHALVPRP